MLFYEIDPEKEYEELTVDIRAYVWERDSDLCVVCGKQGHQVHHIKFRSQGGSHKPNNLCLLCYKCHQKQHSDKPTSVKKLIKRVLKNEGKLRERLV